MDIYKYFDFYEKNGDELDNIAVHKHFLVREFLTWLWFFCETYDGKFELVLVDGGKKSAQIWINDRMILTSKSGKSHEHIIKGGMPSLSSEASISLQNGKAVKELRVTIDVEGVGPFSCTLTSEGESPKNIFIPEFDEQADLSPLEMRLEAISILNEALDFLFEKFMGERTDSLWETRYLTSIKHWIHSRNYGKDLVH